MDTEKQLKIMAAVKNTVLGYLEEQQDINLSALSAYDDGPIAESNPEIRKMREIEAIKLRDRVNELKRHIAVIKRMYPDA